MESFVRNNSYICNHLLYNLVCDKLLDKKNNIKEEIKYKIQIPEFKVQNSKFIGKPEDKFETMLFLPPNKNRKAEGGLRIRGLFKFSYKLVNGVWHICDLDGNPAIPAPTELQEKINQYTSHLPPTTFLPLITVITVVYNGAKYLEDTIKSVINQTYPNVEYIIIDGGSTDGTIDIIKKYDDYIDYWVSEPDKGIYDAMNKGISISFGEWLNMLNSGDSYYNFMVIENIFSKEIDMDIYGIAGNWVCEYEGNFFLYLPNPYKLLEKPGWHINHQAFFYRKITHKILGLYTIVYRIASDYEYIFRLLMNKLKIVTDNSILIKFDFNQNTSDSIRGKWEDFLLRKKYLGFNLRELNNLFFNILKLSLRKFLEKIGLKNIVISYRKWKRIKNFGNCPK
jgi:glycosyltransferase involved in cell wall biosynthesis